MVYPPSRPRSYNGSHEPLTDAVSYLSPRVFRYPGVKEVVERPWESLSVVTLPAFLPPSLWSRLGELPRSHDP